jgi:hypothetical protein
MVPQLEPPPSFRVTVRDGLRPWWLVLGIPGAVFAFRRAAHESRKQET